MPGSFLPTLFFSGSTSASPRCGCFAIKARPFIWEQGEDSKASNTQHILDRLREMETHRTAERFYLRVSNDWANHHLHDTVNRPKHSFNLQNYFHRQDTQDRGHIPMLHLYCASAAQSSLLPSIDSRPGKKKKNHTSTGARLTGNI